MEPKIKQKLLVKKLTECNKELTIKTIDNTIELIDELKYTEDEEYDEIERLIKQGLYLIKFNITTIH